MTTFNMYLHDDYDSEEHHEYVDGLRESGEYTDEEISAIRAWVDRRPLYEVTLTFDVVDGEVVLVEAKL